MGDPADTLSPKVGGSEFRGFIKLSLKGVTGTFSTTASRF